MFKSTFQSPFQNPFSTDGAVAAEDWWLSGGISAGDCVAAYQPKGAASLAASYSNLNSPGTNDAAPGIAPSWNTNTGWQANNSAYLNTGIISYVSTWTIIARAEGMTINGYLMGAQTNPRASLRYRTDGFRAYWGTAFYLGTVQSSGVFCLSEKDYYHNGVFEGSNAGSFTGTATEIQLLASSLNKMNDGNFIAAAVYNKTLTTPEVLSLSNAMNLL